MPSHICIFEDSGHAHLLPLGYFRPVYDLRCGMFSIREKILHAYPKAKVSLHCRAYLEEYVRLVHPGVHTNEIPSNECLFINGRVLVDRSFSKKFPLKSKKDVLYVKGEHVVAAFLTGRNLEKAKEQLRASISFSALEGVAREETDAELISFPWDLIHRNGVALAEDFAVLAGAKKQKKGRTPAKIYKGVYLLGRKNIVVGEGSTIYPGVVLNAEEGPIYIGKNVHIMPQSTIIGPAYIGDGTLVKVGAHIYGNTSIGPMCKVGGEIEGSIIHGYSNKQHQGFLGHSYIGKWANLGAGTDTSDLKNNYGTVKVSLGNQDFDTGLQYVGLTMGDHSKTAIGTRFNTGTIVGACCNVFGPNIPPKYVPSFSWGAAGETITTFQVNKAIEVARQVMKRRGVELTRAEERLFKKVFEFTIEDRLRAQISA